MPPQGGVEAVVSTAYPKPKRSSNWRYALELAQAAGPATAAENVITAF